MKAQPTTKQLIEMLYERLPELFDRAAAQPAPPECQTEAEKTAFAFGWWKALESVRQPAVPDAFGTREGEHPQYIQGWNDCRAEMLKMRKP